MPKDIIIIIIIIINIIIIIKALTDTLGLEARLGLQQKAQTAQGHCCSIPVRVESLLPKLSLPGWWPCPVPRAM